MALPRSTRGVGSVASRRNCCGAVGIQPRAWPLQAGCSFPALTDGPTTAPTAEIDAPRAPAVDSVPWLFLALTLLHRREADLLDHPGRCENPTSPCTSPRVGGPSRRLRHARVGGTHTRSCGYLDVDEPIAYCLPGLRQRVVLSQGTLQNLDHAEVKATPDARAFPPASSSRSGPRGFSLPFQPRVSPVSFVASSALGSVQLLVELLADDSAVRATGPTPPRAGACRVCRIDGTPRGNGSGRAVDAHPSATPLGRRRRSPASQFLRISGRSRLFAFCPTVAVAVPWLAELRLLFNAY